MNNILNKKKFGNHITFLRLLNITFFFFFTFSLNAKWEKVTEGFNGQGFYVDIEKIQENDNFIYFWQLIDYLKPDEYGDLSARIFIEANCKNFSFRWLYLAYHKEAMGADQARVVQASKVVSKWQSPYSETTSKAVLEYVCNYILLKI